jgi:CRP-like cAMP-binding protein
VSDLLSKASISQEPAMITPERLNDVALLKNLDLQYVGQIAKIARLEECKEGTVLFRQGKTTPSIYFILRGEFSLEVEESGGSSVEIARLGRGELLGWSPMLGQRAMTATARALTSSQVAVLDVKEVLDLSERDPRFGMAFLREIALVISERLWGARRNIARLQRHRPLMAANAEGSD